MHYSDPSIFDFSQVSVFWVPNSIHEFVDVTVELECFLFSFVVKKH